MPRKTPPPAPTPAELAEQAEGFYSVFVDMRPKTTQTDAN